MKRRYALALAALLWSQGALAFDPANGAAPSVAERQRNLVATRRHYAQLIVGSSPRLAELTLFTTLLPKGADLHHHYSGAIYAETYLDWVGAQQWCIFTATAGVTDPGKPPAYEKYRISNAPQKLDAAARANCAGADAVRQDNDFYRELLQRWSDKNYDDHYHEQSPPDQQFFDTFGYFGPVSSYAPNQGLRELKARALAENVGYLETMLKSAPLPDKPEIMAALGRLNALDPLISDAQLAAEFGQAVGTLEADPDFAARIADYGRRLADAAAGIDDDEFRLRFQSYVSRNTPPATVFAGLHAAFAAAAQSPLVVGVNIVGPENGVVAMRDYALHMKMLGFLKRRWPNVRLALHAGELALGMVPPEGLRSHIRDAVLVAGASRIGHGVDIAHEDDAPGLLAAMRQRGVTVEVNLSSNAFILGVKDNAHPLPLYRRFGVPFVISTDDAGVSRNNLSGEYMIYASRYKPGYDELKRVVYASIARSFLSDADKRDETARLDRRFAAFERRIARLPPVAP